MNPHHNGDAEATLLLLTLETVAMTTSNKVPEDSFHFAYIIYFALGFGVLLPWNAFITAGGSMLLLTYIYNPMRNLHNNNKQPLRTIFSTKLHPIDK